MAGSKPSLPSSQHRHLAPAHSGPGPGYQGRGVGPGLPSSSTGRQPIASGETRAPGSQQHSRWHRRHGPKCRRERSPVPDGLTGRLGSRLIGSQSCGAGPKRLTRICLRMLICSGDVSGAGEGGRGRSGGDRRRRRLPGSPEEDPPSGTAGLREPGLGTHTEPAAARVGGRASQYPRRRRDGPEASLLPHRPQCQQHLGEPG